MSWTEWWVCFVFLLFFSLVCHSALHSGAHARNWWQFFHTDRLGLRSVAAHQCLPEEVIDVTSARFVLHKGCACFVRSLHQLISNRYWIYQTDGNHDIYTYMHERYVLNHPRHSVNSVVITNINCTLRIQLHRQYMYWDEKWLCSRHHHSVGLYIRVLPSLHS